MPPPIFLMISVVDAREAYVVPPANRNRRQNFTIDRDIVAVPEVVFETFGAPIDEVLRPALDALWNAGGYVGSPDYDETGRHQVRS